MRKKGRSRKDKVNDEANTRLQEDSVPAAEGEGLASVRKSHHSTTGTGDGAPRSKGDDCKYTIMETKF